MLDINKTYVGDCLEIMKHIDDNSIDMILCDLPYGGTNECSWNSIIPIDLLWEQYKRIIKEYGIICLTATQPFASMLICKNPKWFRYEWIWDKKIPRGHLVAKKRPMNQHENVLIFCKNSPMYAYCPQMILREKPIKGKEGKRSENNGRQSKGYEAIYTHKYPTTLIQYKPDENVGHPTQKPVALFEYLIKTYTAEGHLVLDNCAGSGTTGVACLNTKRNFILIEKEQKYIDIIEKRIEKFNDTNVQHSLFS